MHDDNLLEITVNPDTGAPGLELKGTWGILVPLTQNELPAGMEFGRHYSLGSVDEVVSYFGEDSDAVAEAKAGRALGADDYICVAAELVEYDATSLEGTDDSAVNEAVIPDVPVTSYGDGVNTNGDAISITIDGGEPIVPTPVTTTPPLPLGVENDPAATPAEGESIINTDTGEIVNGTATTGDGASGGITATFASLDWGPALRAMANASVDIITAANERYDRSGIGDLDEIRMWAEAHDVTWPIIYVSGKSLDAQTYIESIAAEQDLAQDVGGYVPSKYAFPLSNSSPNTLSGTMAGRFAVEEAEFDPFQKQFSVNANDNGRYTSGNIGAPELSGTFEGGDDGMGMSNVLFSSGATKVSNGLTTAGLESPYRYLDIARAEAFIKAQAGQAVKSLFGNDSFRFNPTGESMIKDALDDELGPIAARDAYNYISVRVPPARDLSRTMRANRFWEGIVITVGFAPTVHRLGMEISFTLATENPDLEVEDQQPALGSQTVGVTA